MDDIIIADIVQQLYITVISPENLSNLNGNLCTELALNAKGKNLTETISSLTRIMIGIHKIANTV